MQQLPKVRCLLSELFCSGGAAALDFEKTMINKANYSMVFAKAQNFAAQLKHAREVFCKPRSLLQVAIAAAAAAIASGLAQPLFGRPTGCCAGFHLQQQQQRQPSQQFVLKVFKTLNDCSASAASIT